MLEQFAERVQVIRTKSPDKFVKERIAENAQELSKAGDMQLRVEIVNEAMAALTAVLYQADVDGRLANIDHSTWRLLIPAPWGRSGFKHWGLRQWESSILGNILRIRTEMRKHINLYDYNDQSRTWHLNLNAYPTIESALSYQKDKPITLAEWRKHADVLTEANRLRMQRYRAR
jgi:hypothetical protein